MKFSCCEVVESSTHILPGRTAFPSPACRSIFCCDGFEITSGRKISLHDQSLEEAQRYVTAGERSEPAGERTPSYRLRRSRITFRIAIGLLRSPDLRGLNCRRFASLTRRLRIIGRFHRPWQISAPQVAPDFKSVAANWILPTTRDLKSGAIRIADFRIRKPARAYTKHTLVHASKRNLFSD